MHIIGQIQTQAPTQQARAARRQTQMSQISAEAQRAYAQAHRAEALKREEHILNENFAC